MNRQVSVLFHLSLLLVICCDGIKGNADDECGMQANGYTLRLGSEIELALDSVTRVALPYDIAEYHRANGVEYLALSDFTGRRINIYDLGTRTLFNRITIEKDGPNAIRPRPFGLILDNLDSIFLFENSTQTVFLISNDGSLIDKFPIRIYPGTERQFVDVTGAMPGFYADGSLHFSGYGLGYDKEAGAILDLKNRKIRFPKDLPDTYTGGWWRGVVYDKFSHTFNHNDSLVIQSFGNDHNIQVVDLRARTKAIYCAKSRHISDIEPLSAQPLNFVEQEQFLYRNEALQGGYSTVKYDPWQKVYYRIALLPVPKALFHSPQQIWERSSVIILDSAFRKIGEFDLPKDYFYPISFVSESGFCLMNKIKYSEREDAVSFGCFKLGSLD